MTHGLFCFCSESVELRLFPHHLRPSGDRDTGTENQGANKGDENTGENVWLAVFGREGDSYWTYSQVSICLMLQLTASFNLTRFGICVALVDMVQRLLKIE